MAKKNKFSGQGGLFDDFFNEPEVDGQSLTVEPPKPKAEAKPAPAEKPAPKPEPKPEPEPKPAEPEQPTRGLRYMSFGSGSSGNCSYVGTPEGGILIDAGIEVEKVMESLDANGVTPEMVKAICLTHDHCDHVRHVYAIVRKYKHIRVYCTMKLMNGMLRRHKISNRIKDYQELIFQETPFKIGALRLTPFVVPHDGTDNFGFFIEYGTQKMAIATDLGHIGPRAHHYISQSQYVVLESNYDREMLDAGYYPAYLKNRIRATNGHLDNEDAANFVASICKQGVLKYLFLCHLSNDNNTPEIARKVMTTALLGAGVSVGDGSDALSERGKDIQLVILPRYDCSSLYIF